MSFDVLELKRLRTEAGLSRAELSRRLKKQLSEVDIKNIEESNGQASRILNMSNASDWWVICHKEISKKQNHKPVLFSIIMLVKNIFKKDK